MRRETLASDVTLQRRNYNFSEDGLQRKGCSSGVPMLKEPSRDVLKLRSLAVEKSNSGYHSKLALLPGNFTQLGQFKSSPEGALFGSACGPLRSKANEPAGKAESHDVGPRRLTGEH